jgi:predicted AlkP superfamily pyrophosphatase or phosphodiesterase
MKTVNPAVTWPNHTALVTGVPPLRHGVLFNGLLQNGILESPEGQQPKILPKSRDALVRVPTVYDLIHGAGLTTAQVDWIPWQTGGTIDWAFEEIPDPKGSVEQEMVASGIVPAKDIEEFRKGTITWRDLIWTRAAVHLIRAHRPNFLLLHLLNTDASHHKYGPRTLAGNSALALADARVAEVIAAIEASGLKDRTTVIVVSDHGFKTITKTIRPNAVLRKAGLLVPEGLKVASCKAYAISEGGTAMVYVRPSGGGHLTDLVKELLGGLEGMERVLEPREYPALGMPLPKDNPQAPDLILVAKPGYGFSAPFDGDPVGEVTEGMTIGLHGYPNTDPDMNAIFIAWGAGIRKGVTLEVFPNLNVAPTIASLFGLRMEGAEGRPLSEILTPAR